MLLLNAMAKFACAIRLGKPLENLLDVGILWVFMSRLNLTVMQMYSSYFVLVGKSHTICAASLAGPHNPQ